MIDIEYDGEIPKNYINQVLENVETQQTCDMKPIKSKDSFFDQISEKRDIEYCDFINNIAKDQDGSYLLNESFLSTTESNQLLNSFEESKNIHFRSILHMSLKNQNIFDHLIRLLESKYKKEKEIKLIWIFIIYYFSKKNYQNVLKMLNIPFVRQNITAKQTNVFFNLSFMNIKYINTIDHYDMSNEVNNLIDFLVELSKSSRINVNQIFLSFVSKSIKKKYFSFFNCMKKLSKPNTNFGIKLRLPFSWILSEKKINQCMISIYLKIAKK